ncbi:uncharacterized protein LOC127123352 [Lathyrus oleraceus]|uniref:uncharacterized protein LOC127123352 n=1 Tax=Pisum sativum TaxID=3888 RepID=UPI0021D22333|nr:uncharacterized protein LOC127123352 [Pisum sativum]
MLFCTINDFPTYGNLSGYNVKGHKVRPICEVDTYNYQLQNGKKIVYLWYRKFLRPNHPYRRLRKAFNVEWEFDIAPKPLTGNEVYGKQQYIKVVFGKKQKSLWRKIFGKKRSIFFYLPYWSSLDVRHCLYVMYVEKNACDRMIGTLTNIKGKTKDTKKSREDMVVMDIRQELTLKEVGNITYLPLACHTLSKKEKKRNVRVTITRLCLFFNAICSKVIDPRNLDDLEHEAAFILCQLKMFFPQSFFDIMVQLVVHLVREIRICGSVYLRWMYSVESYMKIFEGYTKNHHRPEASNVERYITKEDIVFCINYLSKACFIGIPESRHDGFYDGRVFKESGASDICKGLLIEHNKTFINWFNESIYKDSSASDLCKWLSRGSKFNVITWSAYDISKSSSNTRGQLFFKYNVSDCKIGKMYNVSVLGICKIWFYI